MPISLKGQEDAILCNMTLSTANMFTLLIYWLSYIAFRVLTEGERVIVLTQKFLYFLMANTMKGFSISHVNVRSLVRNLKETYVVMLGYDVVCVSETWLHDKISDTLLTFNGYKSYRQDRQGNDNVKQRGGGLMVYIKDPIFGFSNIIPLLCKISVNLEQLWFEICKPNYKRQIICVLYRPPSGSVPKFVEEISASIDQLEQSTGIELTILGDFNINYKKTTSPEYKALKELERAYQLKQYITDPTRVTNKVKSTIDLILTNMSMVSDYGVLSTMVADHFPVYIIKKKTRNDKSFTYTTGRSYKNYDKDIFHNLIQTNIKWRSYWIKTNDTNILWELMLSIIVESIDVLCPIKMMRLRKNVPGWINRETIEAISTKRDLLASALKSGLESDWNLFKKQKNTARKMLTRAKQHVIVSALDENRKDPRRFWRILNVDLGLNEKKSACSHSFTRVRNAMGQIVEGELACNYMNEYYAMNGERLANNFNLVWNESMFSVPTPLEVFSLNFIPMNVVEKLVKNIDTSKSSGILEVNSRILKDAFSILIPELTHLFNESIKTGIFPKSWSIGYITPIPKESDPLEAGNWRPISILPLPSKLLEQAVHYQVNVFLENNNILDSRQHGFRPEYSTSTAIFKLVKDLFENYDKGYSSSCVFVDYKKAFETLDHNILCRKLKMYNFSEISVSWFRSYLSNRKHVVRTNENMSRPMGVNYGVPQGSTLGPLLFILYVNDLLVELGNAESKGALMYADDTVLYATGPDPDDCINGCQTLLCKLVDWCSVNKLTINISKTKHMIVSRNENHANLIKDRTVSIKSEKLHNVSSYRYLGIELEGSLSFDSMVDSLYNKANRKLYSLKNIRPYITNSVASLIYKTCVRPVMEYADFLIDSCTKNKTSKLDRIQKRAVKIIDQAKHKDSTYNELLGIYGIEDLVKRRKKHHLSVMYRQARIHTNIDIYRPETDLRSNLKVKFRSKVTKLTKVQKSPYYRGITLWDRLPVDVQRATTKVKFKRELIRYIPD